MFVLDKGLAIN